MIIDDIFAKLGCSLTDQSIVFSVFYNLISLNLFFKIMQVYCSQEHANNSSHRCCTHCGEALFLTVMRFKGICTPGCENRGFAKS
jgi:hypothetical protein